MTSDWRPLADEAARLWREARCVLVLTGAGISAPSGIPDFRSPGGLWSRFDPAEVASVKALRYAPRRVWEFLLEFARLMARVAPNPAHVALAEIEAAGRLALVHRLELRRR